MLLSARRRRSGRALPSKRCPERTCVGCGRVAPQEALLRVTCSLAGELRTDHRSGRGAWLCRSTAAECAERAVRRDRWTRAFRRSVGQAEGLRLIESLRSESSGEGP